MISWGEAKKQGGMTIAQNMEVVHCKEIYKTLLREKKEGLNKLRDI